MDLKLSSANRSFGNVKTIAPPSLRKYIPGPQNFSNDSFDGQQGVFFSFIPKKKFPN
jgi:hypothetical protein